MKLKNVSKVQKREAQNVKAKLKNMKAQRSFLEADKAAPTAFAWSL